MIPLAGAADEMLGQLARMTGSAAIARLDGETLLGERAAMRGFRIPGQIAAGGFCRLVRASDDWVALNLARPQDRTLLPALFEQDGFDAWDDQAVDVQIRASAAEALIARGRMMGLAIACLHEQRERPLAPCVELAQGHSALSRSRPPRVLDLSALWAGPLAAHLLWLAGCEVTKVESRSRPDAMRGGQPDFFELLNQGKAERSLDLHDTEGRATLLGLIADADIVIEAARPRALEQLGIDANRLVAQQPGLVWLTITGHGATNEAANWVGFGDDCGIAGGLGAAMLDATGQPGFVGDAIADPLTGLQAALAGWKACETGQGGRWSIAMRDVVAASLDGEKRRDPAELGKKLQGWAACESELFPATQLGRGRGNLKAGSCNPCS